MLTDTHCHLNDERFAGRLPEVIARAEAARVTTLIVPGWNRESSLRALALSAAYPAVLPAVGLHPWFSGEKMDWLPAFLDDPRVIAIGEIGLDAEVENADIPRQEEVFRAQLALAAARDLPVILHCRRGWDRLLACLRDTPVRGVIHAFSGSREILHSCLALGLYIGFAGLVTRPNALRAREAATLAPADRILLETDAPNMALDGIPAAQAEPAHLPRVLHTMTQLRGESAESLAECTKENVQVLLRME